MLDEKLVLELKRNSRYGQLADLIIACRQSKTKAELYYRKPKKYHYTLLQTLLDQATKLQLLKKQNEKYETTQKGEEYLKKFEELLKLLRG